MPWIVRPTKVDIVENWLPRTGTPPAEFGEYVLLTNFDNYVEWFATFSANAASFRACTDPMQSASAPQSFAPCGKVSRGFASTSCGVRESGAGRLSVMGRNVPDALGQHIT